MSDQAETRGKALRWISVISFAVALVILGTFGWMLLVYPNVAAKSEAERLIMIPATTGNASELAAVLQSNGIIDNGSAFTVYMKLLGADRGFREHKVMYESGMTPREVALRSAAVLGKTPIWITIPEGYTRFDIAERLQEFGVCEAAAFIVATEDQELLETLGIAAPTAEGYLFPDTYELMSEMEPARVVTKLVSNWQRRVRALIADHQDALDELGRQLNWGLEQVLTLASVVEKEAAVAEERAMIAGVFMNRLRSTTFLPKHRLQADPTVAYGCLVTAKDVPSCEQFDGAITKEMLEDDANPYNTYRHPGLPPGPICNPGAAAIEAVLRYDRHDYLYFVSQGNGRHVFSATLREHNRAVDEFIRTDAP